MSIGYRIDKEKGLAIVQWSHRVTPEMFLAHVERLCSDPEWPPPNRLLLADLRGATLDDTMDGRVPEEAAHLYGEHPTKIAGTRGSVVADEDFSKSSVWQAGRRAGD